MTSSHIPAWENTQPPLYDMTKSYEDNLQKGPCFDAPIPERPLPPKAQWKEFLGHRIASPLGVPAGPLLNSAYIELAARLGFDVLVYKTIRSKETKAHPVPNIVYIDVDGPLPADAATVTQTTRPPSTIDLLAITNSFGMGCPSPEYVLHDIAKAKASLQKWQVLIVSIVGTPHEGEDIAKDFARTAALAKDAGADIITANFSCPNVGKSKEGQVYTDADAVTAITKRIVQEIGDTPLIIKVGTFTHVHHQQAILTAIASAGARGVCGINTVGRHVVNEKGEPALGKGRETSGICGGPIRSYGLEFIQHARNIIDTEKLGLTLLGVGGVVKPEHFDEYFSAGADIAMSATGMMWDPYLAMRWHELHNA